MDTQFAKIVSDAYGTDHILIDGTLISLNAPRQTNNNLVETIVRGLRQQRGMSSVASGQLVGVAGNESATA